MIKGKLAMNSALKKGNFRLFNNATKLSKYNVDPSKLNNLDPNESIEFVSNLTDKSGKAIYDRDIVTVTDKQLPYSLVVRVSSPHGTAMAKSPQGHTLRPLSDIEKKYISVRGHA